jgi:predicted heme/steroid binding protein
MKKKNLFVIVLIVFIVSFIAVFAFVWLSKPKTDTLLLTDNTLPQMSLEELAKYSGDDPALPIYLGLNGLVYDVTPGSEFYNKDGPYHYLAGKDSSADLNFIGGDIIVRKYKPIARLIEKI